MTPKEIIEGNRMIAEFIGCEIKDVAVKRMTKYYSFPRTMARTIHIDDLEYHSSWDWLMPVIKKLVEENPVMCNVDDYMEHLNNIDNAIIRNYNIEETWKEVVEFIKWYNQTKK